MKKIFCLIMVFATIFLLAGCSSDALYVYSVAATGDEILAKVDKSSGLSLSFNESVVIIKDGEILSRVTFMKKELYDSYLSEVNNSELSSVVTSGNKDGNEYMFWTHDNQEWNCIIVVKDSNTAVLISNATSEETAKECFERISFSYYSKIEKKTMLERIEDFFGK